LANTQTLSFDPTGVIQVERSFGDVEIEGWDKAEVQITTIRSTQQSYADEDLAAAEKDLSEIAITAVKQGEDRLKISTDFPSRSTTRLLRSRTSTDLKYVIKAPAQAKIVVHHDIGQVNLVNFRGDIEVTNRIGEIGLRLPDPQAYSVDASARVGDVDSEVGSSSGENLVGQHLRNCAFGHPLMYLRVGIGDITIRKIRW
jgi:hypothetical protein